MRNLCFLYVMVVVCELLVGSSPIGAFGTMPHPYWIVILSMAAAHGMMAGLAAAVLGVGIQIFGLGVSEGFLQAWATVVSAPQHPLVFLAGGFLVGEIHDAHAFRFRALAKQLQRTRATSLRLEYERETLIAANARMKRKIEEQPVFLANMIRSTARLTRSKRNEIYGIALELVGKNCSATKASVLLVENGEIVEVHSSLGWSELERAERLERLKKSQVVNAAVSMHRNMKSFEPWLETAQDDPIFVAPLEAPDKSIVGLLCLDELPAKLLSPGAAAVFFGIAEWANASVALPGWEHTHTGPSAARKQVHSAAELGERLRLELRRAERYGHSMAFVLLQVPDWSFPSEGAQLELDPVVLDAVGAKLGENPLYRFGYPGCYVALLPGVASARGAPADLPDEEWSGWGEETSLNLTSCLVGMDSTTPDVHSLLDRLAELFRARAVLKHLPIHPVPVLEHGHIGDLDALLLRLPLELEIARQTETRCHVAVFATDDPGRGAILVENLTRAGTTLRSTDGLYRIDTKRFALLLPTTDREQAERSCTRLLAALREIDAHAPYLPLRVSLHDGMEPEFDPMSLLQRMEAD